MKAVAVSFGSGRDVLNAYWGFLSNGGLVIPDDSGLREGDNISLEVTIESSQQRYKLAGQVVRRPEAPVRDRHAVIAFAPGEPHDLLLSAAWAETDNVPARRHRRFPVDAVIHYRGPKGVEGDLKGRILNLSYGGCCLRTGSASRVSDTLPPHRRINAGDTLVLVGKGGIEVKSLVRWVRASDVGIEFELDDDRKRVEEFVHQFL